MAKSRQQKKKDREKRVAKQKLAEAARRREVARKSSAADGSSQHRSQKVMTEGVRQKAPQPAAKPPVIHRRSGG